MVARLLLFLIRPAGLFFVRFGKGGLGEKPLEGFAPKEGAGQEG
jgi:hypothetical protein